MVASSYETSRIDPESAHGSLSRLPAQDLPGPHSADRTAFKDKQSEKIFYQVYQGDFVACWAHTFVNDDGSFQDGKLERINPRLILTAKVVTGPDDFEYKDVLCVAVTATHGMDTGSSYDYRCNSDPSLGLTESQNLSLTLRVLHHFIRVAGCDIGIVPFTLIQNILSAYVDKGWWKEHVDATMIGADVMVQTSQAAFFICGAFQELSHALSASKKYRTAADINENLRNAYAVSDKSDMIASYARQGIALFRANDLGPAEEMFLKGLAELFAAYKDRAVSNEMFKALLENLLCVYKLKIVVGNDEREACLILHVILNAVLSVSGLMASQQDPAQVSVLKRNLQKRKAAKKAALGAFQLGSVESFRRVVRSWSVDNQNPDFSLGSIPTECANVLKEHAKSDARSSVRSHYEFDTSLPCNNPLCAVEKEVDELKRCANCKTALYCSWKCQVAHWKEHKPSCVAAAR